MIRLDKQRSKINSWSHIISAKRTHVPHRYVVNFVIVSLFVQATYADVNNFSMHLFLSPPRNEEQRSEDGLFASSSFA